MSHCSSFDLKFKDKQVLFKCMRNLGMCPENRLWEEYRSVIGKKLNIGANIKGRLLTGYYQDLNIFFTEDNDILVPNVESHVMTKEQVETMGKQVIGLIQKEYVKCSMEKMQKSIVASGLSANLTTNNENGLITYVLDIGNGKRFVVSIQEETIREEVEGVIGRSCVDFSSVFETMVGESIQREWKVEYNEMLEDQELQVLRLGYV
ncbi:MAG: DUF2997 domain-containing protein [Lachnospiraceae bacterium]|nr:DUF2997 domain-containing protein [Lachnospiraceae bacterium]